MLMDRPLSNLRGIYDDIRILPSDVTDEELIAFIDGWAALLERENYIAAFAYTGHVREMRWSPGLLRRAIKDYGERRPDQAVTVHRGPAHHPQRKTVNHWSKVSENGLGDVLYDLNIDGSASNLTAIFDIVEKQDGVLLRLNDIRVI